MHTCVKALCCQSRYLLSIIHCALIFEICCQEGQPARRAPPLLHSLTNQTVQARLRPLVVGVGLALVVGLEAPAVEVEVEVEVEVAAMVVKQQMVAAVVACNPSL